MSALTLRRDWRGAAGRLAPPIVAVLLLGWIHLGQAARPAVPPPASQARVAEAYGSLPLRFEANLGQTADPVRFLARGSGYALFLTATEAVLALRPPADSTAGTTVRMSFVGANPAPAAVGRDPLPGAVNYLIGGDPGRWRANVPTYGKVHYRDLYPRIDLVYYGNQRQLEYDFVVAPGADPASIALAFEGAERITVDRQGDLVLHTPHGEIRQHKPLIYQEIDGARRAVVGGYALRGDRQVGFAIGAYDAARPLIIDPVLVYARHLGGFGRDTATAIAVDAAGYAYVAGETISPDFPIAAALDPTCGNDGNCNPQGFLPPAADAFVAKLDPSGAALVYATYLGSGGFDTGTGIAVDAAGVAYVVGWTNWGWNDFTGLGSVNGYQTSYQGGNDAFLVALNPSGSAPLYATLLGGDVNDRATAVAVGAADGVYVAGFTQSADFPATPGAFDAACGTDGTCDSYAGRRDDGFIAKLAPAGPGPASLVYSTFIGGEGGDYATGIAVDPGGNAYVTGFTGSSTFPATFAALPPGQAIGATTDTFVARLNAAGSALLYAAILGGGATDEGAGIAIDAVGGAYVTGTTNSIDFPTTPGALDRTCGDNGACDFTDARGFGFTDAFVARLDPGGAALVYATYLGGGGEDRAAGIALDPAGNAYAAGTTQSDNLATADAPQATRAAFRDAFVAELAADGSRLIYFTYYGGTGDDVGYAIAADAAGSAYAAGFASWTGQGDAFVIRYSAVPGDTIPPDTALIATPSNPSASAGASFSFTGSDGSGTGVASFECSLDGGAFSPCGNPQSYAGLADGGHTFRVRAVDAAGNVDETPASYTWIVDTTRPDTTITASPPAVSTSTSAGFSFTGDDGSGSGVVGFECQLDGGGFSPCTSPVNLSPLALGTHTFDVRATDAVGNIDATPATFAWTILDIAPPNTSIVGAVDGNGVAVGEGGSTLSTSLSITFGGTDDVGVVGFECRLDSGAFAACTSPRTLSGLSASPHTVQIRARDAAGNVDPTPASRSWTVLTPAEGIQQLAATVGTLPVTSGVKSSLTAKLDIAQKKLTDDNPGNDGAACDALADFIAQVDAFQASGKLTPAQAAQLRQAAQAIRLAQACP